MRCQYICIVGCSCLQGCESDTAVIASLHNLRKCGTKHPRCENVGVDEVDDDA